MDRGNSMANLREEYERWEGIHKCRAGVSSLQEFSRVLERFQSAHSPFRTAIFRGEDALYDSANTGHDTFLISKIARPAIIDGANLRPYHQFVSDKFKRLNFTLEEIEELREFQESHLNLHLPRFSAAWIALAQHYGRPTRLLDMTSNPLVALFFACWSKNFTDGWNQKDGVVYMLLRNSLRPQSRDRAHVRPGDIEQGRPTSMYELFEPWALSDVRGRVAHLYFPPEVEIAVNERLRAQSGLFVWWHPPQEQMNCQKFQILIRADAKSKILRALAAFGIRPELLFPDEDGQELQKIFDRVILTDGRSP